MSFRDFFILSVAIASLLNNFCFRPLVSVIVNLILFALHDYSDPAQLALLYCSQIYPALDLDVLVF